MYPDKLKGKKILVAGGAGLLGIHLMRRLAEMDLNAKASYFKRLPPKELQAHYQHFDFTRFDHCLKATRDQDCVIVCAVQASGVKGMKESPTASILPNLALHAGLFEACSQNGVRQVVWISSSTAYQEASYPIREDQLDLNQPPFALYQGVGWVYRYLEALARCYYDKNRLPISVLRTTNIYGPFDHFDDDKSHVIPALIKRAVEKQTPYVVWGNGHTIRDFIYVEDLVEAVLRVLSQPFIPDPLNFSYGKPVSIAEVVGLILKHTVHHTIPIFDETKPTAVPYRVLDNTRFDTLFGGIDRTSPSEGIRKTIDWYHSGYYRE
ncbi:MAG: NAD-dependent epimerase/dehydratase family protein [Desulfatitalea sp.]